MSAPMHPSLAGRHPTVAADRLIGALVPPPRFAAVRFDTFIPDPDHPAQAAALGHLERLASALDQSAPPRRRGLPRLGRRARTDPPKGVYLDGGFGVGKTHLLASLWHGASGPKAFGTFVEFTNLAGALDFRQTVDALTGYRLVCVDEFELDDPGDTVLMATLLSRLAAAGVTLAATSNTLPDRLGEGRFAAADFLREIQALAARFTVLRIDGEDYRHRGLPTAPVPLTDARLAEALLTTDGVTTADDFDTLLEHLSRLHPSRYGALLDGVDRVCLRGVRTVTDQNVALRLVVLADRLYDREIPVQASGVALDQLFSAEMLAGGYRKKYLRAVSRLVALARPAPAG